MPEKTYLKKKLKEVLKLECWVEEEATVKKYGDAKEATTMLERTLWLYEKFDLYPKDK